MTAESLTIPPRSAAGSADDKLLEQFRSEDCALLMRVQRGDEQAMASLYDQYSGIAYSVALQILHDPAVAEEVLESVFMQVWRTPDQFLSSERNLCMWLIFASRTAALDTLLRRRRSDLLDESIAIPAEFLKDCEPLPSRERCRLLIGKLSAEQQTILSMAFFEGLKLFEIEAKTGCPVKLLKEKLSAAFAILRTLPREETLALGSEH